MVALTLLVALIFSIMQFVFPPRLPVPWRCRSPPSPVFAWRQMRAGISVNVEERLTALRTCPWENFGLVISEAYRRQWVTQSKIVERFRLRLARRGQITLVMPPLEGEPGRRRAGAGTRGRDREQNAYNCICITAGEFSANARDFARGKPVTLLTGVALAELVGTIEKKSRRWFSW
jgi:hypothetical protein